MTGRTRATAIAAVIGFCAPAVGQSPGECTSAAHKNEARDRGSCTQTDPRARQQCIDRIAGVRGRAVTRCLEQQNARVDARSARNAETRANAQRRQIEAQRNAQPQQR